MAYIQAQLNALTAAIASGALTVRYENGRTVTYRSLAEMKALKREIELELGLITAKKTHTLAAFEKD